MMILLFCSNIQIHGMDIYVVGLCYGVVSELSAQFPFDVKSNLLGFLIRSKDQFITMTIILLNIHFTISFR